MVTTYSVSNYLIIYSIVYVLVVVKSIPIDSLNVMVIKVIFVVTRFII